MIGRVLTSLRGALMVLIVVAHTLVYGTLIFVIAPAKFVTRGRARSRVVAWMETIAHDGWCGTNAWLATHLLPTRWTVRGAESITRAQTYLLIANHRSWMDLVAMMVAFTRRVPPYKIFIKQQLIWMPVVGQVVWAIDFPFMKRYTREQIAADPTLRGRDVETTQRMFARYGDRQVTIFNFAEGTRITPAKHAAQESPYRHLLRPRAGGVAYALQAIGDKLDAVLDVTFFYGPGTPTVWDMFCGRIPEIVVEVRELRPPQAIYGGEYTTDPTVRAAAQQWVTEIWAEKDARIERLLAEADGGATDPAA